MSGHAAWTALVVVCCLVRPGPAAAQDALPADDPPSEPPPPGAPRPDHHGSFEPPRGDGDNPVLRNDPSAIFASRALVLSARRSTIHVLRNGERVRDTELRMLTASDREMQPRWEEIDAVERRTDGIMAVGLGACLAAPACGGILGAFGTLAALQAYTFATAGAPQLQALNNAGSFLGGAAIGVCAGCLIGWLILPTAFGSTLLVDAAAGADLTPEEYARVVTRHNENLAHNLGLDPSALDTKYFPAAPDRR